MDAELERLKVTLIQGLNLSMQGSLGRKAPEPEAMPLLIAVQDGLEDYVQRHPQDADGWRLLSQAQEALLAYDAALNSLERAVGLSSNRDRRDLKKLALLRESKQQWAELPLSPRELAQLGNYLRDRLGNSFGDRTFRLTREWLEREGVGDPDRVIEAFEKRGAYSDGQVLHNVVRG